MNVLHADRGNAALNGTEARRLQAACRQSGSDGRVVTHTPRHTFGAHHIMHGTDIVTLAQLMGHNATEITEIYAHVTPGHVRRARGRLPWGKT